MAKQLEITKEHYAPLLNPDTNERCVTEKVMDVTEDCPQASKKDRCVFLYTRIKRGRIIHMTRPYEGKEYGMSIFFFVDELDTEMCATPGNDTFGRWANNLGLTKSELRLLIKTHAPAA